MKKCSYCDKLKNEYEFEKTRNQCIECRKFLKKKYYLENREKELLRSKNYRENNKEKIKITDAKYYESNKDKVKYRVKKYRIENLDKIKEYKKNYQLKNKGLKKKKKYDIEKGRKYKQKNKDKINEYQRIYLKKRRKEDPIFKLSGNLRSLIRIGFKNKKYNKKSKTQDILGCSFIDFKLYLESKFENWMNWENYGIYNGEFNYGWDVDHIIPLSSATTEEDMIKLNHYSNLQPLCSKINRDIKIDKIC